MITWSALFGAIQPATAVQQRGSSEMERFMAQKGFDRRSGLWFRTFEIDAMTDSVTTHKWTTFATNSSLTASLEDTGRGSANLYFSCTTEHPLIGVVSGRTSHSLLGGSGFFDMVNAMNGGTE